MIDNVFVNMTITRKYNLSEMADQLRCIMCDKGYLQEDDVGWNAVAYLAQKIADYIKEGNM